MAKLDLVVHIATKLNRSHLIMARESILLPCLGRTELDIQVGGPQSVTVEDSMSMVHASAGRLKPAGPLLKSEPAIVAAMAKATLPDSRVDWDAMVADYDRIRDAIEAVFPIFERFNDRVREPGGFRLYIAASEGVWDTPDQRAHFLLAKGLDEDVQGPENTLTLATLRSHDQYNTTIYGMDDRYRGITGRRDVIFIHPDDLAARGLQHGDCIDVEAVGKPGSAPRVVRGYTAVAYPIAEGSVAMYYPEGNALVALENYDARSGTPSYKSVPVRILAAQPTMP
jgi:anaerobic selenocysteine-containing dehydrogenase